MRLKHSSERCVKKIDRKHYNTTDETIVYFQVLRIVRHAGYSPTNYNNDIGMNLKIFPNLQTKFICKIK